MKKILLFLGAILTFSSMAFSQPREADIRSKTMTVYFRTSLAANVSTSTVLIDLSSTTVFPHKETSQINLTGLKIQVDKVAASTCAVQIGVINFVDSSTGSVTWFSSLDSSVNASNTQVESRVFTDSQMRALKVNPATAPQSDGTTPFLISNTKTSGSTIFQTDVLLPSATPSNSSFSGLGDVVMTVTNGTGAIVVIVEATYHSDN